MAESALFSAPQQQSQELAAPFEFAPPSVVESITRAEIDIQISTAKRFPRDYSVVKRKMLSLATLDQETAETCFYKLSRQGKSIEGPSVRLAEIAASCFGNMRAAAQVVDNDGKTITARGMCHDLENNTCFAVEVKRRITGKDGRTYSEDMQVVTGNAACSIALRNAIFRTVPMALIKPVYDQARAAAVGDIKTLAERRTRMLKAFAAMGVNEARILAVLGKPGVEDIGLAELESLIGIHTAIKDGEQNIDDAFPALPSKPSFTKPSDAATPKVEDKPVQTAKPEPKAEEKPVETPKAPVATEAKPKADGDEKPVAPDLRLLLDEDEIPDEEARAFAISKGWLSKLMELGELTPKNVAKFVEDWPNFLKSRQPT